MNIQDVRNQLMRHPTKIYGRRRIDEIKLLVIHHSATLDGDAFAFARYNVEVRNWVGSSYHYVIKRNGVIQFACDLENISPHVGMYNRQGLGICLVGDFREQKPTTQQIQSLKLLVPNLMKFLNLESKSVKGHKELSNTSTECPVINMEEIRGLFQVNDNTEKVVVRGEDGKLYEGLLVNGKAFVEFRKFANDYFVEVDWDNEKREPYVKESAKTHLRKLTEIIKKGCKNGRI